MESVYVKYEAFVLPADMKDIILQHLDLPIMGAVQVPQYRNSKKVVSRLFLHESNNVGPLSLSPEEKYKAEEDATKDESGSGLCTNF